MKTLVLYCTVAAAGIVMGFTSMAQIESAGVADTIVGGDYNYCKLSDKTEGVGANSTFGCLPRVSSPGGSGSPSCPGTAKKFMADNYVFYESCEDDPDLNNDKECDDPELDRVIWTQYECEEGTVVFDMGSKLDGDTWSCTKPSYGVDCVECTNGDQIGEEKKDTYDCKADDPE